MKRLDSKHFINSIIKNFVNKGFWGFGHVYVSMNVTGSFEEIMWVKYFILEFQKEAIFQ